MKSVVRLSLVILAFAVVETVAQATPLTWYLNGVQFSDGGTATGSFDFDPDAGTPCSTGATPCGRLSNLNITTTAGSVQTTGATYNVICGQDVAACTGISPDSTVVLTLTTAADDQTGLPGLVMFFTGAGAVPPMGFTQFEGTIDISNSSSAVGAGQEALCADPACSAPAFPSREITAGTVASSGSVWGGEFGYFFFN